MPLKAQREGAPVPIRISCPNGFTPPFAPRHVFADCVSAIIFVFRIVPEEDRNVSADGPMLLNVRCDYTSLVYMSDRKSTRLNSSHKH
jgi:hypothetical protein